MSFNLKNEVSLYLRECNASLVNWYPWGDEAFRRAREEKKCIFLSIGYSGSTLCRRMREESFHDEVVAQLLNENFISIKVDRDERADIEKYYKQIYKLMNRRDCSSPISIFMSENLEPFYTATYIPKGSKVGAVGFEELLRTIIDRCKGDRETLIQKGREVLSYIKPKNRVEATRFNREIFLKTLQGHIEKLFDSEHGGFGDIPKFPQTSTLGLMVAFAKLTEDRGILDKFLFTLRKMGNGEIFDSNRGGFFRYANGRDWSNPKNEKLLYENANLIPLYIEAYRIDGERFYKDIAIKSMEFLREYMSDGELFYNNLSENILDKKLVTSSNSMAIDALFQLSTLENRYRGVAIKGLERLLEKYYVNGELYHTVGVKGFLEDYAYLGVALLTAYKITENEEYLIISQTLLNRAIEKFYEYGVWKFSDGELVVYDDSYDLTYPSSISTILHLMESISPLVEGDYREILFRTLEINSYTLMRQPLSTPKMSQILLHYLC